MIPRTKYKFKKQIDLSIKFVHITYISFEVTIWSLLQLLKHMKADRKSIVVPGSLDITPVCRLKWPSVPKQDPRCLILDWILVKPIENDRSMIVDSDGLDLTSVSLPGWSFMPGDP